jgi:hypothetical protein
MVSLWDLLTVLCCAMPVAGALRSAKFARAGFFGYTFAIAVGLLLGLGCAYSMRTVGKTVAAHLEGNSASVRERYLRALYFTAMMWIVLALFLGSWASSALLKVSVFCAFALSFSSLPLHAV